MVLDSDNPYESPGQITDVLRPPGDGTPNIFLTRRRVLLLRAGLASVVLGVLKILGITLDHPLWALLIKLPMCLFACVPVLWSQYHLIQQMSFYQLGKRHRQYRPLEPAAFRWFDALGSALVSLLLVFSLG